MRKKKNTTICVCTLNQLSETIQVKKKTTLIWIKPF